MDDDTSLPRYIRPALQPLGLYFRVGRNDHTTLTPLLAHGQRSYYGVVVDAARVQRHRELLKEAERARLECILDPCTQASATIGGYGEKLGKLPWGLDRPHRTEDFEITSSADAVSMLADFVVENRFSQTMAPTHYIKGAEDRWLNVDVNSVHRLRDRLDQAGGKQIGIIYSLCLPYGVFRDEAHRERIIGALDGLPVQSLWLRVDGCGADSSPTALRNYIAACRDFSSLELPIVADQIGGLTGLSLLALSATGGLATGLAVGERFDASHWHRPQYGRAYMAHPRVYLPTLDVSLDPKEARALFEHNVRLKGLFGCKDPDCCARGVVDMIEAPARHFAVQRIKQVAALSRDPESLRPGLFVERFVRPTTDHALQLSKATGLDDVLRKRFARHRHRLDALRLMLGKLIELNQAASRARIPKTRAMREGSTAAGYSVRGQP